MVKGLNDKQSGFWMYLEKVVRPELERKWRKRLRGPELHSLGQTYWAALSYEEKEEWKARAKEFNKSEVGQREKMSRRIEYRHRRHVAGEPTNVIRLPAPRKLKPSNIIPPSRRYDEVDEYSRKYFAGVDDDFEGMREHDLKEFIDHYQWKFSQKGPEIKEDFFCGSEVTIVTANVYYEDTNAERMVPSEISILKFSVARGIYDQRHFILGFGKRELPNEVCMKEAVENEQRTGLLMDAGRMCTNVRFDYARVWDEIKAFTGIDGDGSKLLLLSDDWNIVVGSFDALFMHARERSFSRIETRFATIQDYFMAMYATMCGVKIDDSIKLTVAGEMRERWPGAVFFDLVTCDFHANMRYTDQCRARSCSLFVAHEAAFNFFTLCKKCMFRNYKFTGRHMPEKEVLPTVEGDFLECRPQRLHTRSSAQPVNSTSLQNIPQSPATLPVLENRPLKSILKKPSVSLYHGRSSQADSVPFHSVRQTKSAYSAQFSEEDDEPESITDQEERVRKWLQDQRLDTPERVSEMDFPSHNPHLPGSFMKRTVPPDPFTDQMLPYFVPSASIDHQEIPPDPRPRSAESRLSKNTLQASQLFPMNTGLSSGGISESNRPSSPVSEHDQTLIDLGSGPVGNESDNDMFSNVSLRISAGGGQDGTAEQRTASKKFGSDQADALLKKQGELGQTSSASSVQVGITSHSEFSVGNFGVGRCQHSGSAPVFPVTPKSALHLSTLNQSRPNFWKAPTGSFKSLPYFSQKAVDLSPLQNEPISGRTLGGFSLPSVVGKSPVRTKQNSGKDPSFTLTLPKEFGSRVHPVSSSQKSSRISKADPDAKIHDEVSNGIPVLVNPYLASNDLAQSLSRERSEASSEKYLRQPPLVQRLVANSVKNPERRMLATNNAMFTLEPLVYTDALTLGWSVDASKSTGQEFVGWLNSVHF